MDYLFRCMRYIFLISGIWFAAINISIAADQVKPGSIEFKKAELALKSGDTQKATILFEKSAQQGNLDAQFNLGLYNLTGIHGFKIDPVKAMKWFKDADDNGDIDAPAYIGIIHFNGQGVPVNQEIGLQWINKAVKQGSKKGIKYKAQLCKVVPEKCSSKANNQKKTDSEIAEIIRSAQPGHLDEIRELIKEGAALDEALFIASFSGNADATKLLLDSGANVNNVAGKANITPLIAASIKGHLNVVRILIEHGGDVNMAEPEKGATPLIMAVVTGHTDLVRLLIANKVDVNKAGSSGNSPLDIATDTSETGIVKLLTAAGAGVDKDLHPATAQEKLAMNIKLLHLTKSPKTVKNNTIEIQALLSNLNYDIGAIDGLMGGLTREALNTWEAGIERSVPFCSGCVKFQDTLACSDGHAPRMIMDVSNPGFGMSCI